MSVLTRQWGASTCACSSDSASRHGRRLYLKFSAPHEAHSVSVRTEQGRARQEGAPRLAGLPGRRRADSQIAAGNRERLLRELRHDEARVKAQCAKGREKARSN